MIKIVLLTEGLNRIKDLLNTDIFKCQAGTGTTAPTEADTGLETADSNTLLAPTKTTASSSIQVTHVISSTIGSGNAYSEQETQLNSGSTSLNRLVHTALTKGSKDEFSYITTIFLKSV